MDLPEDNNTPQEPVSFFHFLEIHDQDPSQLAYWGDPDFQALLINFQHAEWETCMERLTHFLELYPQDKFLPAFKEDVEVRLKLQAERKQRQEADQREKLRKRSQRVTIAVVVAILASLLFVMVNTLYQARTRQARLDLEATQLAQTLAFQYQNAESYLLAGQPAEALRLYTEIQKVDPSFADVAVKIEKARESVAIEELYQQGIQAAADGRNDQALEIFLRVDALRPKYKDTSQLIETLREEKQIAALTKTMQDAFALEDWDGVAAAYEAIKKIDPFIDLPGLKEVLFISYRNLIIDIAGRTDATLEDIETAENYYRTALALFPQNREFSSERESLQQTAIDLVANKYYLYGIGLLESSNYSSQAMREAIRLMTKADSIGSGSPAIQSEIDKAQLFLNAYESFLHQDFDSTVTGLEELRRLEDSYAGGRVKYLLYESYLAKGDALFTYADFEGAALQYQEAEKFAWRDQKNSLRLFQVEVRIAATLRKLWKVDEAASYYHDAFARAIESQLLSSSADSELKASLDQANQAYASNDMWEAVRLYEILVEEQGKFFNNQTIMAKRGETLADIAFQYGSTLEQLRRANHLGESMTLIKDQELVIPVLNADQP
jgi:tetratricopeptide (TPR) repeat protein